jgi:hypothetical protein
MLLSVKFPHAVVYAVNKTSTGIVLTQKMMYPVIIPCAVFTHAVLAGNIWVKKAAVCGTRNPRFGLEIILLLNLVTLYRFF